MRYFLSFFWYLMWLVAALHLIMTAGIWLTTVRTQGLPSLTSCWRMLTLTLRGAPIRELLFALALPLVVAILAQLNATWAYYIQMLPINAFALIAVLCLSLFFVPPAMIVLSTSSDAQLRWALGMKKHTAGQRVITLLDTTRLKSQLSPGDLWRTMVARSGSLTDVLRTPEKKDWRRNVKELFALSPVILVDGRVSTPALIFEATLALSPEFRYKTIFVSENDGKAPLLDSLPKSVGSIVTTVKENELGPVIQRLTKSKSTLPKPA